MDLFHRSCAINLGGGLAAEDFTLFVRVTNSYNASRAVRLDVGFMRGMFSNGVIFSTEATKILASHTDGGIRHLRLFHPFADMAALVKQFGETVADVRAVSVTSDQGAEIARRVIGLPALSDKPTPCQRDDQQMLDANLVARRDRYFGNLGANTYAAFNFVSPILPRIRRKSTPCAVIGPRWNEWQGRG